MSAAAASAGSGSPVRRSVVTAPLAPEQQGSNSARASVATLLNSAIGAGVLSLPFAYSCAGWAGGLISTVAIASIEAFTLYVLARYAEWTGMSSYSQMVRKMLGRKASMVMSLILLLYSFGSSVAYLIILGDCFSPLVQALFGETWYTSRQSVIVLGATAFMLPLCFPTTLGAIASVSYLTFWSIMLVVAAVVYRSSQVIQGDAFSWDDVKAFDFSMQYFKAVPILVFGFQCHTNVVAVFGELEEEPSLFGSTPSLAALADAAEAQEQEQGRSSSRSANGSAASSPAQPSRAAVLVQQQQRRREGALAHGATAAGAPAGLASPAAAPGESRYRSLPQYRHHFSLRRPKSLKLQGMVMVVSVAIGLTCLFYVLVGLFGYFAFPTSTASNILNNYPASDRLMQATRAVVGVIQIAHYPVTHHPARNALRDLLHALGWQPHPPTFNIVETLLFFCSTLLLSLVVKDLGTVFSLIGGSCGAAFILGFPGALLIQYTYSKQRQSMAQLAEAQQPLLADGPSSPGAHSSAGSGQGLRPYQALTSKLFWSGVLLILLCLFLFCLTVYNIVSG